jgi:nitrate reductase beta subunit
MAVEWQIATIIHKNTYGWYIPPLNPIQNLLILFKNSINGILPDNMI